MTYGLRTVTPPTAEPVTLAEARAHARIDTVTDDAGLAARILAARQYIEQVTGRALLTQTLELSLDDFPCGEIALPRAPVASIVSVTYTDTAGATQTVSASDYTLDGNSLPPRLVPAYGKVWPSSRGDVGNVKVQFVAGETAAPRPIVQAILLLVADWNENRETPSANPAVDALLAPYRTFWF